MDGGAPADHERALSFEGPDERLTVLQDTCVSTAKREVLLRLMARKGDLVRARLSGSSDSGVEIALLLHDRIATVESRAPGRFEVQLELRLQEPGVVKLAWSVPAGVGLACVHAKSDATDFAKLELWRPS